jgi:hypothetical protein
MTRPHELRHRPGCDGPMKPPNRVGGWRIARCAGCGATEVRRADDTKEQTR